MLTDCERAALSLLDLEGLHRDFRALASFVRRSDGDGERAAREYVRSRLERAGVRHEETFSRGVLAFGGEGRVGLPRCGSGEARTFAARAWNFSAPADGLIGRPRILDAGDFPSGALDYLSSREPHGAKRDLEGCVVLSRFVSAEAVLDAQSRGALGFVVCWPGGTEREIHQSGLSLGWGTPLPEEACWSPGIPVLAVNGPDGEALMDAAAHGTAELSLSCASLERIADVPLLEAHIPPTTAAPYFLLIGAHLDSKHYGATDNATGAALALSLAEALARVPQRRWGVRVCWWSGHEFGKYAGSSLYARDRFDELDRYCLAYSNIDMPGMVGAAISGVVTAGPDLLHLAGRTLQDVAGRAGGPAPRIRAWDQSFQNIGVSPFFIWTSALPPDSPHRTGGTSMPWWWHTEADTAEFCDPEILETDARIYMTGILRFLSAADPGPFDVASLWNAVLGRVRELEAALRPWLELTRQRRSLEEGLLRWTGASAPSSRAALRAVRLLNRIHYAARDAHLQDWSGGTEFVPGLSEALRLLLCGGPSERAEVIVLHYARVQANRLSALAAELESLARER